MLQHKGTQEIDTKRLRLRRFCLSDAEEMFKNYATDAQVTKFLSWKAYENVEDVRHFLQAVVEEYSKDTTYHWAMEFEGEVIGSISVVRRDEKNHSCEIGYCIGRAFWNRGITSEAVSAVLEFLFCEVGMHRVIAKHDVENPASGMVMKKNGMLYEGRLREHYRRHDGSYSDSLIYAILRDDFLKKLVQQ